MRSLIHKYFRYLLPRLRGSKRPAPHPGPRSAPAPGTRGFLGGRSGVVAVRVALAMPVVAKTMGRARAVRDASGVVAVEFALIGPVLLLAVVGMLVFGIALNNYVTLTNAAEAGALQFAISRGASTPYTDTTNQIKGAAPGLTPANLTITLSVNGTACASDSACQTALTASVGKPAFVQALYPCIPTNLNLTVMGKNYAPSCTLTVKTTERIQ